MGLGPVALIARLRPVIRRGSILAFAAALLLWSAAPARADPAVPAAAQPVAETAAPDQPVPALNPGRVMGVALGVVLGDILLHGVLGVPGLPSLVAGGVAGWYVYTAYIEPQVHSGMRRIATAADDVRLYWTGAADPG